MALNGFLQQDQEEAIPFEETYQQLQALVGHL